MANRFSPDRLTDKQLDAFARRYEAGELISALVRETDYTYAGLHAALKRRGVKFRGRRGPSPKKVTLDDPRVVKALALRDEGMGYARAAEQSGLASITLRRLLVESGRDPHLRWKGAGALNWKGGRQRTAGGYIKAAPSEDDPVDGMQQNDGYVLEHRLVMARSLGRPLTSTESVHHKNGKRDDNRLENLQMRQGKHGNGQRHVCADCGSHNIVPATLD